MARTKGSLNKRNVILLAELIRLGVDVPKRIVAILNSETPVALGGISDRDRLHAYLELLQYIYPKRKAIELEVTNSGDKPKTLTYIAEFGSTVEPTDGQLVDDHEPDSNS